MAYNAFSEFNFNDAEENLYKLLIQISKIPRSDTKSRYNKIKVTDLVEISKYSKSNIYDIIKRLADKNLIQIENIRPMFIRPVDPEQGFKRLANLRKSKLDEASLQIIKQIESLPKLDLKFPFSNVPPFSYFDGVDKYYKILKDVLESAKDEVVLISGFLVKVEEELLSKFIGEKSKSDLTIRILYGGSIEALGEFRDYFYKKIIEPNKSIIEKRENKVFIDTALFAPPLRITIVDDSELIMALKQYQEEDMRINIHNVSGLHSNNQEIVRSARDSFILLRKMADLRIVEKLMQKK